MLAAMVRIGLAEVSQEAGLDLSARAIHEIAQAEADYLAESGRICFREGAAARLVRAFSDSAYLAGDVAGVLANIVEAFYEIREDMPALVTDEEIVEKLDLTVFQDGVCTTLILPMRVNSNRLGALT